MNCPDCLKADTRVMKSFDDGVCVKRARACACGHRFNSTELSDMALLAITTQGQSLMAISGQNPKRPPNPPPVTTRNHDSSNAANGGASPEREGLGGFLVSASSPSVSESDRTGSLISPLRESVNVMSERRRRVRGADYSAGFLSFWAAFPRKEGKGAARDKWTQLAPPLDAVLAALAWQCTTEQWRKDGGAFVPHPATYLNQRRWEDEKPGPAGGKPPPVPGAPPGMGEYCEFHKVVLNYRKPAFRPKATCPDCKHAAAVSRERTPTEPQGLLGIGVPK